jgi:cation transport regulator ChaB
MARWVILNKEDEELAESLDGIEWEFFDAGLQSFFETLLIEGVARGRKNYVPGDKRFDDLFWEEVTEAGYEVSLVPDGEMVEEVSPMKAELVEKPAALLAKLPKEAREIYERVYEDSLKRYKGDEGKAAAVAIEAVKNAGYKKDEETGKWVKRKMELADAYFTKASKDPETGEMRWAATVSKFDEDDEGDIVTPEFFQSAIASVKSGLRPSPVLCVSHVDKGAPSDGWVAGDTAEMYVDGDYPKAKGTFRDTRLGRALYEAVRADIKNEVPHEKRVRISMGFFDEGSEPVDNGTGRKFKSGWIKHFAGTRVPVVKETVLMTEKGDSQRVTLKEDLTSIVGEELAAELLQLKSLSEGDLVIKANKDQVRAKLKELLSLLEADDDEETAEKNRDALGNEGTNVPEAEPAPKAELENETELEEEENKAKVTQSNDVDAFVDSFATGVKVALKGDGDRRDKFASLQRLLDAFGEGVVELVKGSTEPSAADIGETVQQAVVEAVRPLQQELLAVKAELDALKSGEAPPASVTTRPTSMDTRVVMAQAPIPASGGDLRTPTGLARKARSAYDLAWESTQDLR